MFPQTLIYTLVYITWHAMPMMTISEITSSQYGACSVPILLPCRKHIPSSGYNSTKTHLHCGLIDTLTIHPMSPKWATGGSLKIQPTFSHSGSRNVLNTKMTPFTCFVTLHHHGSNNFDYIQLIGSMLTMDCLACVHGSIQCLCSLMSSPLPISFKLFPILLSC